MTHRYLLFLIIALPFWLLQGCSSLEQVDRAMQGRKPTAQVEGVRLKGLDLQGVDLVFDVNIDNPNPFAIDLTGFDYDLQLFDRSFLKGEQTQGMSLAGKSDSSVEVPLRLTFRQLLNTYQQLKQTDLASYRLDLGLGFKMPVIGSMRLPINAEGDFPVPRIPDLKIKSLAIKQLSLEKADLLMQLEVDNPNSFSLLLQELNYHLKLNGVEIAKGLIDKPLDIKQSGSAVVTIPLSVDLLQAGIGLYSALLSRSGISYDLNGTLDAATQNAFIQRFQIPLNKQGSIKMQ
jgi:LEA14-like dessication related protein